MTSSRLLAGLTAGLATLAIGLTLGTSPASALGRDSDRDGMPNRWERAHGLRPYVKDALRDKDHDRLTNIVEYRRHLDPADEDTDNDGMDDSDEVRDGSATTNPVVADTDHDGTRDGDEDVDRDGIDNEDADDVLEPCAYDDDDTDRDGVRDEDENDQGTSPVRADSDRDGIRDGDEDSDHDGVYNDDDDDSADDRCSSDHDDDGPGHDTDHDDDSDDDSDEDDSALS